MKIRDSKEIQLKDVMDAVEIKPMLDFIVLKKQEHKGKIQLLDNSSKDADVFTVLEVGPGHWQGEKFIEPTIKKGDKIFLVGNVYELKHEGTLHVLSRCRDVVAILNDKFAKED